MKWIEERIRNSKANEIQDILQMVLARYRELFPDWDVGILSVEKEGDRIKQLDRMIALLETMKR